MDSGIVQTSDSQSLDKINNLNSIKLIAFCGIISGSLQIGLKSYCYTDIWIISFFCFLLLVLTLTKKINTFMILGIYLFILIFPLWISILFPNNSVKIFAGIVSIIFSIILFFEEKNQGIRVIGEKIN